MRREGGPLIGLGVALIGVAIVIAHAVLALSLGKSYAIPTTIVAAVAATVILRGPLGQALAKRIQGGEPAELPPEQVLNELDEFRGRLTELEERADFSERMLARQRESETPGS